MSVKRIDLIFEEISSLPFDVGVSATELADKLSLARANVSYDLNRLFEQGLVDKKGTRPVLYYKKITENSNKNKTHKTLIQNSFTIDEFLKKNPSLQTEIEKAKAAVLYPPNGMHMLILGETGVGKSMFANLIYKFAVDSKILNQDSPFIVFNCADYANNPQLLLSQLFGVKKGAYTGANEDKVGLVEISDGGILFLDEVHRLPPEGQEMFFTFMDRGEFRRLGETDTVRKSNTLIIAATTENPNSSLLKTFTRRIPMLINLPNLKDRSLEERLSMISIFFTEESFRLKMPISVSINSLRALSSYNCPYNVGQLKSDIQLICAKSYADYISGKKDAIYISSIDLPKHVQEGLYQKTYHRQFWNKLLGINSRYAVFDYKSDSNNLFLDQDNTFNIYEMIDVKFNELKQQGMSSEKLEEEMDLDIERYFAKYLTKVNQSIVNLENLENVVGETIINVVEEIALFCEKDLNRSFSPQVFHGLAVHISNTIERLKNGGKILNPHLAKIRANYPKEFQTAVKSLEIVERVFDVDIPIDEAGFIAMFFVYEDKPIDRDFRKVEVLVVAHGESTASSMADTANRLLGIEYAHGINARLDESPQDVLKKLYEYIKVNTTSNNLLLLVDMGSLMNFGKDLENMLGSDYNIKTIPLVSTLHVLEATRKASLGYTLADVYNDTLKVNSFMDHVLPKDSADNPLDKDPVSLILTICTTGKGSAMALKKMLNEKLNYNPNHVNIVPLNLVDSENIYDKIESLSHSYNILCIVSSFMLNTDIPQISLSDVFSGKLDKIQDLIDLESFYRKIDETLSSHLVNIDGKKAVTKIKAFIKSVEDDLRLKNSTDILIGIILHIGYNLDNQKASIYPEPFLDKDSYINRNPILYSTIKKHAEKLYSSFDLKVNDDELCYLMMFFDPERRAN